MMDDQKILDNAPEGATHIENNSNLYIKVLPRVTSTIFNDWFIFEIDQWIIIDTYNVLLMRSLADIKELVELRKANAELESKLAGSKYTVDLFCVKYKEIEKECNKYKAYYELGRRTEIREIPRG
jgi:hypothetical protein